LESLQILTFTLQGSQQQTGDLATEFRRNDMQATTYIAEDPHTKLAEGTIEAHIVEKLIDITIILFCIAAAPMGVLALNALPVMGV
jgi:hypothetical protein